MASAESALVVPTLTAAAVGLPATVGPVTAIAAITPTLAPFAAPVISSIAAVLAVVSVLAVIRTGVGACVGPRL
jgi:hypothetical protein